MTARFRSWKSSAAATTRFTEKIGRFSGGAAPPLLFPTASGYQSPIPRLRLGNLPKLKNRSRLVEMDSGKDFGQKPRISS
jgi:hypothetical protein